MYVSWWELSRLLVVGHYVRHSFRLSGCLAVECSELANGCFATLAVYG